MDYYRPQYFYDPRDVVYVDETNIFPFTQIDCNNRYYIDYGHAERSGRMQHQIAYERQMQDERRIFVEQLQREQRRMDNEYNAMQASQALERQRRLATQMREKDLDVREKIVNENIKTVEKTLQKIESLNGAEQLDAAEPRLSHYSPKKEENGGEVEKCCVVCWDRERNVVCLPCTHLVMCFECSGAIKSCPICKRAIENSIKCIVS